MQKRHTDRRIYFKELANTSRDYYLDYVSDCIGLTPQIRVLEIGCGEGGNLAPFSEKGCTVTGIDIDEPRIENAKLFFQESGLEGTFIYSDFLSVPVPEKQEEKYDLVLVHDVIEHIEPQFKIGFMTHMKAFMKPDAVAFFGFPAWQMPFGGHQQICVSRVSKLPFIHLLPEKTYCRLLAKKGESQSLVNELCSIRRSKMPIEKFEKLIQEADMHFCKRTLWIINPHYKQKFHLLPLREIFPLNMIPYLRNFYTTAAWYILKANNVR